MMLSSTESQLVLIDYQTRLMPAIFEGPQVLATAARLAQAASLLGVPRILTAQCPDKLGANDASLTQWQTHSLDKRHFDACQDGLIQLLREVGTPKASPNARSVPKHLQKPVSLQRPSVVLTGVEAHICLLQTALSLLEEEDFEVWVVVDGCSSRSVRSRDAAFDRLAGAGAELVTAEMVAFEWLGSADHPQFKVVQALFK
jgi:nicotinamidase-related amidase